MTFSFHFFRPAPLVITLLCTLTLAGVASLCLTGCAGPRVQIQSMIPAEKVDLASQGVKRLAIGEITGANNSVNGTVQLGEELRAALVELKRFEVLDRSAVKGLLQEHQLNASGLVNEQTTASTGKFTGATALIIGSLTNYTFKQQVVSGQGGDGKTYYSRVGTATIQASFKIVDVASGALIAVAPCSHQISVGNSGQGYASIPQELDPESSLAELRAHAVAQFVNQISPRPYLDSVELETDSDVPAIGFGNTSAQLGDWAEARKHYTAATAAAPSNGAAYYNLGIACRALGQFDEALAAFKKAYQFNNKSKYLAEVERTKRFAKGDQQK